MQVLLGNSLAPSLRDYFKICASGHANLQLLPSSLGRFTSTEAFAEIKTSVDSLKGQPVTIIQSLAAVGDHTANDLVMELALAIRTLKRNGAGPIWVIAPFMAYGRQDRPFGGRMTSIAIDDYAGMLKWAGATGISTIELHSAAGVQYLKDNFGDKQVYNLAPTQLFAKDIKKRIGVDIVIGGPDMGANERADAVAKILGAREFDAAKRHTGSSETELTGLNGAVANSDTGIIDDMIDTGGTIKNAAVELAQRGAVSRHVYAAHGIFSNDGLAKLFTARTADAKDYAVTQLVVTDTIDIGGKLAELKRQYGDQDVCDRVRQLSVGPMLFKHITRDIIRHPAMKAVA